MREIKFRGMKDNDKDEWVYGYLTKTKHDYLIGASEYSMKYYVKPETIGQSLGGYDCNHTEIFEGDIVEYDMDSSIEKGVVVYDAINGAYIKCVDGGTISIMDCGCGENTFDDLKVVGNIHEKVRE
jgi:hypothetical protein